MNGKKSLLKRVFSCFLSVALMATVLPVSAFAALSDGAKLYIVRAYVNSSGEYTELMGNATGGGRRKTKIQSRRWK